MRRQASLMIVAVASLALTAAPATQSAPPVAPAAAASTPPKLAAYKQEAVEEVDGLYDLAQQMVDSVFSFGDHKRRPSLPKASTA